MSFAKLLNYTHALLVSEGIRTRYKTQDATQKKQIKEADFDALFK